MLYSKGCGKIASKHSSNSSAARGFPFSGAPTRRSKKEHQPCGEFFRESEVLVLGRSRKITLVAAGGACYRAADIPDGGEEGHFPATVMLDNLRPIPDMDLEVVEWSRQPSSHYTIRMVTDLAQVLGKLVRDGAEGLVVSAGTDVLEEMTYLVHLLWSYPQPVIFTGSFVPWNVFGSDAGINLRQALLAAAAECTWGLGVLVCLQDQLFSAAEITKEVSHRRDAFRSPGRGPVGEVSGDHVFITRRPSRGRVFGEDISPAREIPILYAALGCGESLLAALAKTDIDGLILAGFGRGNVPPSWIPHLRNLLRREIPVVITSRCHRPRVVPSEIFEGGTARLLEMGVLNGGALRPLQARLRLSVGLGAKLSSEELQTYLLEG